MFVLASHSAPATAGKEEWVLSLLPQYTMLRAYGQTLHGGGLAFTAEYGFTDSWGLKGVGAYSALAVTGQDPGLVSMGLLGLHVVYTVDILRVVPYFPVGVECVVLGGKSLDLGAYLGLSVGFGLDYLIDRKWSVGLEGTYRVFVPDTRNLPASAMVGVRLSRRFF